MRHLQGVLSLTRRYQALEIKLACAMACRHGGYRYRIVKSLLARRTPVQQAEMLLEEHPVIRPLADYGEYVRVVLNEG